MQNPNGIKLVKLDIEPILSSIDEMSRKVSSVTNYESFLQDFRAIQNIVYDFQTQYQISQFRFFNDTSRADLKDCFDYYSQNIPSIEAKLNGLGKLIAKSKFIDQIRKQFGDNYYYALINSSFDYTEKAIELSKKEHDLQTEVLEFKSQSKVDWEGSEVPVTKLLSFTKDANRSIRKKAFDTIASYYTDNKTYFYDKLIEVISIRNELAKELGFNNYAEYSVAKWNRIGYGYKELKSYRDQVAQCFSECNQIIHEFKKKNLGLNTISYYDNNLFDDGFPELLEKNDDITISKFKNVLNAINPDWEKVYAEMLKAESIDYKERPNKAYMGYATYLMNDETPVIYSLFQNNSTDVRVLSHEFGHTLQFHLSYFNNPEKKFIESTLDTVEIFSHSMEMFCLDETQTFFGNDTQKYNIENYHGHLRLALSCAMGDEFQETIYKLKDLDTHKIQETYRILLEKYTGNLTDCGENEYYSNGDRWMEIDHFFHSPFYLVDYSLAIINALNIYKIYKSDKSKGMEIWETLAKNLSNLNYKNITDITPELKSPFNERFIEETAEFSLNELKRLLREFENKGTAESS